MDLRKGAAMVATNLLAPFRWGENIRADSPAGSGYLERRRAELPDRLSRYPSFGPDSEALTNTGADRCEVTPISRVPFHDPHLVEHQSIRWRGETEMRGALTMATLTSGRAVTAPADGRKILVNGLTFRAGPKSAHRALREEPDSRTDPRVRSEGCREAPG